MTRRVRPSWLLPTGFSGSNRRENGAVCLCVVCVCGCVCMWVCVLCVVCEVLHYFPCTCSSMGNAQEMVKQAKLLAEATSALVNAIKLESENENDPDARRRLLDAARALADATSKMVEAAKSAARNPGDEQALECGDPRRK